MGRCELRWFPDRGFELNLEAEEGNLSLRVSDLPLPVDGTLELSAAPVAIDRLEVLFKAEATLEGAIAQVVEATVQLAGGQLIWTSSVEDVETGEVFPFTVRVAVQVPPAAPAQGGPRPVPADEDELDWQDETTLEQMGVTRGPAPRPEPPPRVKSSGPAEAPSPPRSGMERLLAALLREGPIDLDDEDPDEGSGDDEGPTERPEVPAQPPLASRNQPRAVVSPAMEEAEDVLEMLLQAEALELSEGARVDDLVPGVARLLAIGSDDEEELAARLSAWLLEQPAVADLFIDDEKLGEILKNR
jgi:hypothetical protein